MNGFTREQSGSWQISAEHMGIFPPEDKPSVHKDKHGGKKKALKSAPFNPALKDSAIPQDNNNMQRIKSLLFSCNNGPWDGYSGIERKNSLSRYRMTADKECLALLQIVHTISPGCTG